MSNFSLFRQRDKRKPTIGRLIIILPRQRHAWSGQAYSNKLRNATANLR